MRKFIICVIAVLVAALTVFIHSNRKYKREVERLVNNEKTLLSDVERFRVSDSLNAARVGVLSLTVDQFKQYRAEDARIIREMGIKNRELQDVTSTQAKTIIELRGTVRDSLVYVDRVITDTLRCIDIVDKWFSLHGCTNRAGEFTGTMENRDSIVIAGTTEYKRFLGFLWYTRKVKRRNITVVSRNPHTKILGAEYIELNK